MSDKELERALKRLFCKCGHNAELHLWVDDKPLYFNPLHFDSRYTIGKCRIELSQRGDRCQCTRLDFEDKDDWGNLEEQMNKKIESVNRHKQKFGIK